MEPVKYVVKRGDSLSAIADRFYNNPNDWKVIAEENDIEDTVIHVGQKLVIPPQKITIPLEWVETENPLQELHYAFPDGVSWRLVKAGVEVDGAVERTVGEPSTITRIFNKFRKSIILIANKFQVPSELMLATIATESGGNADARREEPGFKMDEITPHRVSVGLMQTLISTARAATNKAVDADWLKIPINSMEAGVSYIVQQEHKTHLDPPKVCCAYNAGGIYHQSGYKNRWKMRQYPIGTGHHADRFVKWYNDAVAVLETEDCLNHAKFFEL